MKQKIHEALRKLASERQLFHSEADFQFELAIMLKKLSPDLSIRVEKPFDSKRFSLDLMVIKGFEKFAIELKYKTKSLNPREKTIIKNEFYCLTDQNASNLAKFDFWADFHRVSSLKKNDGFKYGYTIFLSNDSNYWENDNQGYLSSPFNINDGRTVKKNTLFQWSADAKDTSVGKKRKGLIFQFDFDIQIKWELFSELPHKNGVFKYLLLEA